MTDVFPLFLGTLGIAAICAALCIMALMRGSAPTPAPVVLPPPPPAVLPPPDPDAGSDTELDAEADPAPVVRVVTPAFVEPHAPEPDPAELAALLSGNWLRCAAEPVPQRRFRVVLR